MNVTIEGNSKKPTKQWPNNLYYECEFIAEHYLNTLVKFWNFSHCISGLRAIDCSSCDCVSRHDDCSRGWDFISGIWPFSNFFLNMGRERRWPRWIKKALHIGIKRLWFHTSCTETLRKIKVPLTAWNKVEYLMTGHQTCFPTLLTHLACGQKDVIFQEQSIHESSVEWNSLTADGMSLLLNLIYIYILFYRNLSPLQRYSRNIPTTVNLIWMLMAVKIMQWHWSDKPAHNLNIALMHDNHMRHLVVKTKTEMIWH